MWDNPSFALMILLYVVRNFFITRNSDYRGYLQESDEFLDDLMVLYIEKELTDSIDNDYVIAEFELSGSRRVRFR